MEWAPLAYTLLALVVIAATAARVGTARIPRLAAAAGALALIARARQQRRLHQPQLAAFHVGRLIAVNLLEPAPESNCETARRVSRCLLPPVRS